MVGLLIESKATIPMILLAERKNNFICLRLDLLNRNPYVTPVFRKLFLAYLSIAADKLRIAPFIREVAI